jgi:hypothetical protein
MIAAGNRSLQVQATRADDGIAAINSTQRMSAEGRPFSLNLASERLQRQRQRLLATTAVTDSSSPNVSILKLTAEGCAHVESCLQQAI